MDTNSIEASWFAELKGSVMNYCRNKLNGLKRKTVITYKVPRRGDVWKSESNASIYPGRRMTNEKMDISVSFFIDISSDMEGESNKNSFEAAYTIGELLKKAFIRDRNVNKVLPEVWAFNTSLKKCDWGEIPQTYGERLGLDELLENIKNESAHSLVNIVITDGEFLVDDKAADLINKLDGLFIYVTHNSNTNFGQLAQNIKDKVKYIKADTNFTLELS